MEPNRSKIREKRAERGGMSPIIVKVALLGQSERRIKNEQVRARATGLEHE
jgi:hypothetical protein